MLTVNFKHIPIRANDYVLDLGCGEGRHAIGTAYHFPESTVIGLDLSFQDLQSAQSKSRDFFEKKTCTFIQANGFHLPFSNEAFDHIICSEVLEHIQDYQAFLIEITRILKPGGTLSISVPTRWPEKICWLLAEEYAQVEGGHVRIFNHRQLREEIAQLRYEFIRQHKSHALHTPYWWLKCIFWNAKKENVLIRSYHKLLVWDLLKRPLITQALEQVLNPFIGKSHVAYFKKAHDKVV